METQKNQTRKAYRQGELLFVPVNSEELENLEFDPGGKKYSSWNKLGTNVIREGEATGHKHEVIEQTAGTATMLEPARQFLPSSLPPPAEFGFEFVGMNWVVDYPFRLKDRCRMDTADYVFQEQFGTGLLSTPNGWQEIADWISYAKTLPTKKKTS